MRIKVRSEEIAIGILLGVASGVAITSPLTAGLASYWPHAAGFSPTFKAALVILSAVTGGLLGGVAAGMQEAEQHVRGVRYEREPANATRTLSLRERESFSKEQRGGGIRGVEIGHVELSRSREVGHIYCVGLPGSGKTVVLRSVIDQVLDRGDRVLLHDPKGDLTAAYFDSERAVLLGAWDDRADLWDAAADVDSPALADEFAATVCDVANAGENRQFHQAAADLLSGMVKSFLLNQGTWTWAQLGDLLGAPVNIMVTHAGLSDPRLYNTFQASLKGEATKFESSVIAILSTSAGWIRQIAAVDAASGSDRRRFSMRRWMTGEGHPDVRLIVLNSNTNYERAGAAIFGSILAVSASVTASASMAECSADDPGLWFVLDEFPQLGAESMRHIQRIAELGRSRGVRQVLALQDESQVEAVLGREKSGPVLNMQGTRVYLRTSPSSADAIAKRIGEREIMLIENTAQSGAVSGKTIRPDRRHVLSTSDLMGLTKVDGGMEALLHIDDHIGRVVQPFSGRREALAVAFVESRAWRFGNVDTGGSGGLGAGVGAPQSTADPVPLSDDDLPFDVGASRESVGDDGKEGREDDDRSGSWREACSFDDF